MISCIGDLINTFQNNYNTMEMTVCVGDLIKNLQIDNDEAVEMTVCVNYCIKE